MIDSMLRIRLITAALLGPLVIVIALLGEPWLSIMIGAVIVLGMIELTALLRAAGYEPPPRLTVGVGLLVGAAGLVAANRSISDGPLADLTRAVGPLGLPTLAMVGATVALALAGFTRADPRSGFATWATTTFGVAYLGLLAPFIVVVGHLSPPGGAPVSEVGVLDLGSGTAWLLLLIVVVWGYDSGAYLVGRWLGRRRLIAHISPSKTIEGLAGGLLVATVAAGLGVAIVGLDAWHAVVVGPLLGLAAQAGDLAESLAKRAAGRKESGSLIPGHGGMLDRVDSFLFAAPVLAGYALVVVGFGL